MFKILTSSQDNPVFQHVLSVLRDKGFELEAINPDETLPQRLLEKTKHAPPDLIILDSALPEQQGHKSCKTLKNNPQTEAVPVIFIQSDVQSEDSIEAKNGHHQELVDELHCGANDVISDPRQEDELIARIHAAIRTKMTLSKSKALVEQLNQINAELYERNLAVEKELYTTRQLQQSLLPPIVADETVDPAKQQFSKCHFKNEHFKVSGIYLPCDALGGDIYDVIKFSDGAIGISIADVSGHGVPAAFVTAIYKSSLYRASLNYQAPGDILFHLNNELSTLVKTGHYITTVYCRIEEDEQTKARKLQFSGAGHPYPFFYSVASREVTRLQENGTPLAWFKDMEYATGEVMFAPGDKILLFTDGISEMKNAKGDFFGEEALQKAFQALIFSGSTNPLDDLMTQLSDFTEGHPLDDDLSIVLIEALA